MIDVAILMATYNGEKYIAEQIDSIINQTYKDWKLYIRDDGSTDATLDIIKEYAYKDPRIVIVENNDRYHGAFINFHYLLNYMHDVEKYNYYFFCDQDDIWMENKIELVINSFNNANIPELIYSDMTIINEIGEVISESRNRERSMVLPNDKQLYFTHLYIWGCTVAFNKELFNIVPLSKLEKNIEIFKVLSHDNYFAKFALECGKVTFIDSPLIKYRRHGKNVSDYSAKKMSIIDVIKKIIFEFDKTVKIQAINYSQTLFTISTMKSVGIVNEKLRRITDVINRGGIKAIVYLYANGIKKETFAKNLGMYFIFLTKKYKKYILDKGMS